MNPAGCSLETERAFARVCPKPRLEAVNVSCFVDDQDCLSRSRSDQGIYDSVAPGSTMPRTRVQAPRAKAKISVSLDADLYDWAVSQTGAGKQFASISHALERGLRLLQEHGVKPR